MHYPVIILKSGKEQSIMRRHPWIFSGAIKTIKGKVSEGDVVQVIDNQGGFLAIGHYQPSSIAVRVISFEPIDLDADFWFQRLASAYAMRRAIGLVGNAETNVYRLVHGEGDNLPGLVIDIYNRTAVMQFHSVGMYKVRNEIYNALIALMGENIDTVYDKSESTIPFKSEIKGVNQFMLGNTPSCEVLENGNRFRVDWVEGQKTGFFVDQRENRLLVQRMSHNRKVLNMFCYTGGFSVSALKGGAELVHSVDSSKIAVDLTNNNIELNFPKTTQHEAFAVDAFSYLNDIKDRYDLIILDPPAFAKHQDALHNALQGYKRLNQRAIEQIRPGGLLFTFSCSQAVNKEDFRKSVFVAAANARRKVSILYQLTQPADHAINMYHPEGEYLKGLVCYVE
jgi:23S rRNA (cytosine1962-C5)-methyltransferase